MKKKAVAAIISAARIACISGMLGMSPRGPASRSAKGMVALAWRARLGPRLAYQLQLRMGGLSPRQALAPRNGEWPLTADEMVWHLEFFGIADSQLRPVSPGRDR